MADAAEQANAMWEFTQAIADDILTLPELSDPEWDTYSMVAEVTDDMVKTIAFRYSESGPPVSTTEPENDDLFWVLRDQMRGPDGAAVWDVVLVKIHRDTVNLVMDFASGPAADTWRLTPENMAHLPEAMRPRPEDFQD